MARRGAVARRRRPGGDPRPLHRRGRAGPGRGPGLRDDRRRPGVPVRRAARRRLAWDEGSPAVGGAAFRAPFALAFALARGRRPLAFGRRAGWCLRLCWARRPRGVRSPGGLVFALARERRPRGVRSPGALVFALWSGTAATRVGSAGRGRFSRASGALCPRGSDVPFAVVIVVLGLPWQPQRSNRSGEWSFGWPIDPRMFHSLAKRPPPPGTLPPRRRRSRRECERSAPGDRAPRGRRSRRERKHHRARRPNAARPPFQHERKPHAPGDRAPRRRSDQSPLPQRRELRPRPRVGDLVAGQPRPPRRRDPPAPEPEVVERVGVGVR